MTATDDSDRTCDVHWCAADPCVVHREDQQTRYLKRFGDHDAPRCELCGTVMEVKAMAVGGGLQGIRHKYQCPECGDLTVVNELPAQRSLSAFAGGEQV